jgi:hypothetical protein
LKFLFPEKTKGFEISRAGDRRPKKEKLGKGGLEIDIFNISF